MLQDLLVPSCVQRGMLGVGVKGCRLHGLLSCKYDSLRSLFFVLPSAHQLW